MMKLTYQTGIAALAHLGIITVLNIANGLQSGVQKCTDGGSDCVGNIITSMLYFMLTTGWFVALWLLAVAAQDRRSRKLALLLIAAEGMVFIISLFNARGHTHVLGLVTSLVDAGLAVWVALLALRLYRAKGGRVISSERSRRRRLSNDS